MKASLIALSLASMFAAASAQAIVVTQWNFNSVPADSSTSTGSLTPNIGAGSIVNLTSSALAFATAQTTSTSSSDPATVDDTGLQTTGYAAQGTGNKTTGVRFNVDTTGWQDIVISWDQRHSNTSARHVQFQYSTDGINFVDFGSLFEATAGDTWFNNRTVDLSSITGVNNNDKFAFRIVSAFAPSTTDYAASNPTSTYGTAGTWRFDMVTVNAAPVPEAETYAMMLAGLGLVGFMAARRRKAA